MKNNEKAINWLEDKKSNCMSIITNINLSDYLSIIQRAYADDGAIEGQRKAQTSKSAIRIRKQMVSDFLEGGVLPPVVIGITDIKTESTPLLVSTSSLISHLKEYGDKISIIDGMQRTTAMKEAVEINKDVLKSEIRIEVWIAQSITKLIYRMLVLNTGQLPWSLRRQIEVVMQPIKKEISCAIPNLNLIDTNSIERRRSPGYFQSDKILESFLIFGTRTQKVESRDLISEEFIKLDFIDSASKGEILNDFISILKIIVEFDSAISNIKPDKSTNRFDKGIDLFTSQPALAGLICALAIKIYGRPGSDYEYSRQKENLERIRINFLKLVNVLKNKNEEELSDFMRFETLNTILTSRSSPNSKIGDLERNYFKDAFTVLVEEKFEVDNMDVCWRA